MGVLAIKRVYEPATDEDGARFLVDRLWPRGIRKERAALTEWVKALAPSPELRKLFHSSTIDFPAFAAAYQDELNNSAAAAEFADRCRKLLATENVTLVYSARSQDNNATVLLNWLQNKIG